MRTTGFEKPSSYLHFFITFVSLLNENIAITGLVIVDAATAMMISLAIFEPDRATN